MDCVFKAWGYVPRHRLCTKCQPLMDVFSSLGYDKKETSKVISRIFKAYTMMTADDVLRDETSGVKKVTAKLLKKLSKLRTPEELKLVVEKADRTIRDMEASQIDAKEYVRQISAIGGQVFEASANDERAFPIGTTLSAATTIHDMNKDLEEDKRKGVFNPLKNVPADKISAVTADLLTSLGGDKLLLGGGPQTRAFSPQVALATSTCWQTCIGVCAGVCSALALYHCCCE